MPAETDFDQARRRVDARRNILRALAELSSIERRQLLADLLLEAQDQQGAAPPADAPPVPSGAVGRTFSARALELLSAAPDGLTVAELGTRLYPSKDPRKAKHNARSILRWLSTRGSAKARHGRWFRVEASALKKRHVSGNGARTHQKMTIPEVVLAILRQHPEGLRARELIEEIGRIRPDVDEKNVRSTVYRESTNSNGKIVRSGTKGDFSYFFKDPSAAAASEVGGRH